MSRRDSWKIEMAYSIYFSPQAVKDLENLDKVLRKQLIATMEKLEESPQYYGKRLKDIGLWSLRSGKYRVIFEIDDERMEVCIHAIGHRKKIYRRF
jgi:mRNA interferase RelE/StbE